MSSPILNISTHIFIQKNEIQISAVKAQGPGGQHVNKVATAIHLKFDIARSSLPDACKTKLFNLSDHRITKDGVIIIKAQSFRSLEKNKEDALRRLVAIVKKSLAKQKKRLKTKPTRSANEKRLRKKSKRAHTKSLRRGVSE